MIASPPIVSFQLPPTTTRLAAAGASLPSDDEYPLPIHAILREELAEALQPALTRFEEAVELEAEAQVVKKHRDRELADVREICDGEIRQLKSFLQVTLELAGHDFLSQRVLGKRRGRPRKTAQAAREAERQDEERPEMVVDAESVEASSVVEAETVYSQKIDSGLSDGSKASPKLDAPLREHRSGVEKCDSDASSPPKARRKFDLTPDPPLPTARTDDRKIEATSITACTAEFVSREAPRGGCTGRRKIEGAPCKPCTEASGGRQVVSFEQDTPRRRRRKRRRVASARGRWRRIGTNLRQLWHRARRWSPAERP